MQHNVIDQLTDHLGEIKELMPDPANARRHSDRNIEAIMASLRRYGQRTPIVVQKDPQGDLIVRKGNGTMEAAIRLGWTHIARFIVVEDDTRATGYAIADNRTGELAEWDEGVLSQLLESLPEDEQEATGFDQMEIDQLLRGMRGGVDGQGAGDGDGDGGGGEPEIGKGYGPIERPGFLADKYMVPPFSVLDTKQAYWTGRRREWLDLTGNLTESKEGVLAGGADNLVAKINDGSSNFDPVLAELIMRWFAPPGGKVLDPFGGEQTKGVVAGYLGNEYHAVEFRQDQVDINVAACSGLDGVHYTCGDSQNISDLIEARDFNLCFTSPPYYDLEIYSDSDMSSLGSYEEFMEMYERIFEQCVAMLAEDAFLVVKVGEIRDPDGVYRNFLGDNISIFNRLGLSYYNEIVLLNSIGTAPLRAARYFTSRKVVKIHQNVLVFVKGDWKRAAEACGELDLTMLENGATDEDLGEVVEYVTD